MKTLNLKNLKPHPLGAIFPSMNDEDYDRLVLSIKERGLGEDIVLHEGMILDGNHRYSACKKARVKPTFVNFKDGDPISFVISKNLARRNLNTSQAAALGAELVEKMREQDKEEKAAAKAAKKAGKKVVKKVKSKERTNAARAAKMVNVSERSVESALALKKGDPEEFENVKKGKKRVKSAMNELSKKKSAKEKTSDAFADARAVLAKLTGEEFATSAEENLKPKEFIQLSGLDGSEIERVTPLISAGWKLKDALGYKSTVLSLKHPMKYFIDECLAKYGQFTWEGEAYGKTFRVNVEQQ